MRCVLERMVVSKRFVSLQTKMKSVLAGGSSKSFSNEFADSIFINSGCQIIKILYSASKAFKETFSMIL